MWFWNFCHETLGMHTYYVLAIVIAAIMGGSFGIQRMNQKKRDKENKKILGGQQEAAVPGEAGEESKAE